MSSKMRSAPPLASADDFISGAEKRTSIEQPSATRTTDSSQPQPQRQQGRVTNQLPWEDAKVREDVAKVYNLRLPEPYLLKLKYIAEKTPGSMQQFCLDALLPAIDKKIKELT